MRQVLDISKVSQSTSRRLVRSQVVNGEERNLHSSDLDEDPVLERCPELQSGGERQQVNPLRFTAELDDHAWFEEIRRFETR